MIVAQRNYSRICQIMYFANKMTCLIANIFLAVLFQSFNDRTLAWPAA